MRFIAVLGVLFVLASCSDSDTPENFGLSCYRDNTNSKLYIPESNKILFEFNFDKNVVIRKTFFDTTYEKQHPDLENSISKISSVTIVFGSPRSEYILNRANLTIRQDFVEPSNSIEKSSMYKCVLPKI